MAQAAHPRPAAGDVLDRRYRLVTRLGHGGFGDVWRAEELLPDGAPFRDVALKLLLEGGADAVDWAEEAKLLASFRHPSLVTIYAAGILATTTPQRFVAMELLEGQNLADLLRARGKIPWRRVLSWAASAAAALDLIHAAGVVHLDLKPANLFLTDGGALKVLDFGIARRAGVAAMIPRRGDRLPETITPREAEVATGLFVTVRAPGPPVSHEEEAFAPTRPVEASGDRVSARVVIGTPGFMAPEVLELGDATAAADAYALAVCVVQLVTGHLPLAAPDEPITWEDPTEVSAWLDAIRRATLRGELKAIDAAGMGLPRGLATLIKRLLSVDPAQRGVTPGKLGALFDEVWRRPYGVPDPPYFGLVPFPPQAEGVLFGRDDDIARLGRELSFEPAVVLQGPRGGGKSSLAMAGLVPFLAQSGADGKDDWIAVRVAPGDAPDEALDEALGRVSGDLVGADVDALASFCADAAVGLVLLFDPLDALALAKPEARARTTALASAIATGPVRPGLRLLGALREESAAALGDTALGVALRAALRFVGPPPAAAVRDIVAAPAHFAGTPMPEVDRIAADVQRELRTRGARLPYVALALGDFWAARGRSNAVTWESNGGVRGAVVRPAARVFAARDTEDRAVAEELLLRLSTTSGQPTAWDEGELCEVVSPDRGARVVDLLERAGLVFRARAGVEIGHEALLTEWRELGSARLAQMDRLAFLEKLREARLAWERADNHKDFLLRDALLDEARTRGSSARGGLGAADRAFIAASRRRANVRRAARGALGAVVVALAAGGAWGQTMLEEARVSEARAKAAAVELKQITELAARARRTEDPYQRVAFAAAAMDRGSLDGLLPIEIGTAAANVARASFLTIDPVTAPSFPWDDRFLIGLASPTTLTIVDFRPSEPDAIDDVDLDFDPAAAQAVHFKMPTVARLSPHASPLVERVSFAFDTAFATRAADGEVKVFRLRDDGSVVLAAIAPMRCVGAMHAAVAAPVIACATEEGVARWDLRKAKRAPAEAVKVNAFPGAVADLSADGARVAAFAGSEVLLWAPGEAKPAVYHASRPVKQIRLSPRDRVAALLQAGRVEIVAERTPKEPIFTIETSERPETMRWDPGGLDLALCAAGHGRWRYLKRGGRAKGDAAPRGAPCAAPRPKNQPQPIQGPEDYTELADRELGAHVLAGGWKLRGRRFLSHDLVLFDASMGAAAATVLPAAARLLRFEGKDEIGGEEPKRALDSVVAVERDEAVVMFQVADEVRFYAVVDGSRLFGRKGNFLRRCPDARYLSWRVDGATWRLRDAWTGAEIGAVPREPGLVVGSDAACTTLYTQRLDGTLVATPIAGGAAREIAVADGYVHLARPSAAHGALGAGLLVALSSGAIARIDDAKLSAQVLAYATPRATAIADGPAADELVYADATGVVLVRPGAAPSWLKDGGGGVTWEDVSVAPDGASILLASDDRVAVLDVARREILGSAPIEGRGRLSRWDDEGSVLAWSFGRNGGAEGTAIPRGVSLAKAVSSAISNLVVDRGRVSIKR